MRLQQQGDVKGAGDDHHIFERGRKGSGQLGGGATHIQKDGLAVAYQASSVISNAFFLSGVHLAGFLQLETLALSGYRSPTDAAQQPLLFQIIQVGADGNAGNAKACG